MPVKKKQKVDLKAQLLHQIKEDIRIEQIDLDWYRDNLPNLEQCRRECVENIREENEEYQNSKKKTTVFFDKKQVENTENIQQVYIENLMLIVQYLKQSSTDEKCKFDGELEDCIRRQNSNYSVFWDSSSNILLALKQCLLARDWEKMSRFLLILLNYGKKYIPIIRNYCRVMLQYWPLIREIGLESDFILLTGSKTSFPTIV